MLLNAVAYLPDAAVRCVESILDKTSAYVMPHEHLRCYEFCVDTHMVDLRWPALENRR